MDTPADVPPPRKRRPARTNPHRTTERWNNADYAQLLANADRAGLTVASYIRSRSLTEPTMRARKQAPIDYVTHAATLRQFAKLAINVNQIARHLNTFGFPVPPELAALATNIDADRVAIMAAMGRGR